jgi:hypothetical protein
VCAFDRETERMRYEGDLVGGGEREEKREQRHIVK